MGTYRYLGDDAVVSPFYADGLREIEPGDVLELPDSQPDGSPLHWSPEHFERTDTRNPLLPPEPEAAPPPDPPTPPHQTPKVSTSKAHGEGN